MQVWLIQISHRKSENMLQTQLLAFWRGLRLLTFDERTSQHRRAFYPLLGCPPVRVGTTWLDVPAEAWSAASVSSIATRKSSLDLSTPGVIRLLWAYPMKHDQPVNDVWIPKHRHPIHINPLFACESWSLLLLINGRTVSSLVFLYYTLAFNGKSTSTKRPCKASATMVVC